MGPSMMGTGEAEGEERAAKAAEAAISNPLLEDYCLSTATGVPACSECPGSRSLVRPPRHPWTDLPGAGLPYALERRARAAQIRMRGLVPPSAQCQAYELFPF